jgi:hypothetical protein
MYYRYTAKRAMALCVVLYWPIIDSLKGVILVMNSFGLPVTVYSRIRVSADCMVNILQKSFYRTKPSALIIIMPNSTTN